MAASNLFKKLNVQDFETASRIQKKPSKSCFCFCSKSLVIILVLVVIPLFPSQAPDFINQSILTKFWELLYLLFIGVAVSYGLFSRRSVKMEMENHSGTDTSHPYLSAISNVSSFFEDGFENVCISDEKKMMQNWNPQYLYTESTSKGTSAADQSKKIRSLTPRDSFQHSTEADRENASHIWNSQYFPGESLVVVTDGNYTPEDHIPLGLPVRSLRSRASRSGNPDLSYRSDSDSSLKSFSGNDNEDRIEKIRGMTLNNLQCKFEEVVGTSTIPWKSRSERMEMREVGNSERPGHSRHHSIAEFESRQLRSRSFKQPVSSSISPNSLSSRMTRSLPSVSPESSNLNTGNLEQEKDLDVGPDSISHSTVPITNSSTSLRSRRRGTSFADSPEVSNMKAGNFGQKNDLKVDYDSSSHSTVANVNISRSLGSRTSTSSSVSPEVPNLRTENLEQKKDLKIGRDSILHSTVANVNNGLPSSNRGFSIGFSSELNMHKSSEDDFKEFRRSTKKHLLGSRNQSSNSISSDAKASNLSEILSRAKSVRTIRSSRYTTDKMKRREKYSNQVADELVVVDDQFAASISTNAEIAEAKDPPVDTRKQNSDKVHPVMSSPLPEHQNKEKQDFFDGVLASEVDFESHSECENHQNSSDENENKNVSDEVDDEDLAGSEVDRKADEFIAKFREQIRLQKIASARKHNHW